MKDATHSLSHNLISISSKGIKQSLHFFMSITLYNDTFFIERKVRSPEVFCSK